MTPRQRIKKNYIAFSHLWFAWERPFHRPSWHTTLFQRSDNVIWTLWTLDGRWKNVVCHYIEMLVSAKKRGENVSKYKQDVEEMLIPDVDRKGLKIYGRKFCFLSILLRRAPSKVLNFSLLFIRLWVQNFLSIKFNTHKIVLGSYWIKYLACFWKISSKSFLEPIQIIQIFSETT